MYKAVFIIVVCLLAGCGTKDVERKIEVTIKDSNPSPAPAQLPQDSDEEPGISIKINNVSAEIVINMVKQQVQKKFGETVSIKYPESFRKKMISINMNNALLDDIMDEISSLTDTAIIIEEEDFAYEFTEGNVDYVTLNVSNIPAATIIDMIIKNYGVNVVYPEELKKTKISLTVTDLPSESVISMIADKTGCEFIKKEGYFQLKSPQEPVSPDIQPSPEWQSQPGSGRSPIFQKMAERMRDNWEKYLQSVFQKPDLAPRIYTQALDEKEKLSGTVENKQQMIQQFSDEWNSTYANNQQQALDLLKTRVIELKLPPNVITEILKSTFVPEIFSTGQKPPIADVLGTVAKKFAEEARKKITENPLLKEMYDKMSNRFMNDYQAHNYKGALQVLNKTSNEMNISLKDLLDSNEKQIIEQFMSTEMKKLRKRQQSGTNTGGFLNE